MNGLLPKPLIVTLGMALIGVILVIAGAKLNTDVPMMIGVLLIAVGGLGSVVLFLFYLVCPPKRPDTPPRKGGIAKRFAGVCMVATGIALIVALLSFILFPDQRAPARGPGIVVIWLGLPVLLLYGGWQMITGKV